MVEGVERALGTTNETAGPRTIQLALYSTHDTTQDLAWLKYAIIALFMFTVFS